MAQRVLLIRTDPRGQSIGRNNYLAQSSSAIEGCER